MELGLYSFAELAEDPSTGAVIAPGSRLANLLDEARQADHLGLEVFGVGEHHRRDFAVSSPFVVLGAIAAATTRVRLTTAVTVLSSLDPVRVFQDLATVDLLSGGRAEIMVGRGSFIESFPLFGLDLDRYDELFAEKLELLLQLQHQPTVTWSGRHRPPLRDVTVYPRPIQAPIPTWLGVGGTPASFVRAGQLNLPLALAIIGGQPARFVPLVDLYRRAGLESGHDLAGLKVGLNSHTYVADTSQQAADEFFPSYAGMMSRIGRERGWPPMTRTQFDQMAAPEGSLVIGSPQQVIEKILYEDELFDLDRFLAQMSVGAMPHAQVMRSIELFATVVAPAVRKASAARRASIPAMAPAPAVTAVAGNDGPA